MHFIRFSFRFRFVCFSLLFIPNQFECCFQNIYFDISNLVSFSFRFCFISFSLFLSLQKENYIYFENKRVFKLHPLFASSRSNANSLVNKNKTNNKQKHILHLLFVSFHLLAFVTTKQNHIIPTIVKMLLYLLHHRRVEQVQQH